MSPYYREDPLDAFDLFYCSERYPGCRKYKRVNEYGSGKSGIDLWGIKGGIEYDFTHASIAGDIEVDGNMHGYNFESKCGSTARRFHPRNALRGDCYGKILFHYEPLTNDENVYSLEESIADGRATMNKIVLSSAQEACLKEIIEKTNTDKLSKFEQLYINWNAIWINSNYSNPYKIIECKEFEEVYKYCMENENIIYILYYKLFHGENATIPILEKVLFDGNNDNKAKIRKFLADNEINKYNNEGKFIIYSTETNLKSFVKSLIPIDQTIKNVCSQIETIDNTYKDFNVIINKSIVNITIGVESESNIYLDILDLKGTSLLTICNNKVLEAGLYNFECKLDSKGIYLLRYINNGNLDVKKISIH